MPLSPKFKRLAIGIPVGLVVLIGLALLMVHTPPARMLALRKIEEIVRQQGIVLEASELQYNLFSLTASLRNVVVKSQAAPDLPPVAQIAFVQAKIDLRQLLRGSYIINDAVVEKPNIHVVLDASGRDNLPKPPAGKSTGTTTFVVEKLRSTGGVFHAEERRQHIDVTLPLWSLAVDGNVGDSSHHIQFQTGQAGRLGLEDRGLPIRELSLDALVKDTMLDIKSIKLVTEKNTIASSGVIQNFNDPRFDIRADTNLNLGSLVQFAGVKQKVDGDVKVQFAANGPLGQMQVTAVVSGTNVSVEGFERVALDANATYTAVDQRIRVASLTLRSPYGGMQANANVALTAKAGTSDLNAKIQSLDLSSISRTLKLPVLIASRADGTAKATWQGLAVEKADGDASVRLSATRSNAAKNVVPVSGSLTATSRNQNITLNIASLNSLGAAASGRITVDPQKRIGGEIHGSTTALQALMTNAEAFLGKPRSTVLDGSADITAKLAGTLSQPQVTASLKGSDLSFGPSAPIKGAALTADFAYNPNQLTISTAEVRWNNQVVTANGTVGLKGKSPSLNLTAKAENASIETLLAAADRKDLPLKGNVNLNAAITGTVDKPQVSATVSATNLVAYEEPLGSMTAQVQLANNIATVTQLRLEKAPGQTLTATGSYDLNRKTFLLDADGKNLELTNLTLPGALPVRGVVTVAGNIHGTLENPEGTLRISADRLLVREEDLGSVTANVDIANKQAKVDLAAPKFNLAGNGVIEIDDPYQAEFQITAKGTDLAKLPLKLEQPLVGNVTATVQGKGEIKNWKNGSASAHVDQLSLTWNGQPIRTEGPLDASFANGILNVQQATVVAENSRVTLQGTIPVESDAPPGDIRLQGAFDLASLMKFAPQTEKPVTAQGQLALDGTLHGSLKRIEPNVTLTLKDGLFSTPDLTPVTAANAAVAIRNGTARISSLTADWAGAKISATGEVPLGLLPADLPIEFPRQPGPAKFNASLTGLQIAALKGVPENVSGSISLHVDAEAPKPEIDSLTAKVTFDDLKLNLNNIPLQQQGASTITLQNSVARIDQFKLTGPDTLVELSGTASLNDPRPLDLKVNANLDAQLLAAFTKDVRARGVTNIQLAVTGTAENPQAAGFAEMKNGEFNIPSPRIQADNLNLRVEVNGTRVNIARLDGGLNGGTLTGSGGFTFENSQPTAVDLRLQAKDVYVEYPAKLKTVSKADLTLRTQQDRFVLGGEVDIVEGSYTSSLNLDQGLASYLNKSPELGLTEERNATLERLIFNIAVKTQYPLVVDNNLAKVELNVDTRVVGNFYNPALTGRVDLEEGGKLNLNERNYLIDRGVITFTSEQRIEPNLDVLARTQAAGYDITLQIQGTPDKLETTFTSDPPLPEPDIIAVLLTGRKVEELRGQEVDVAKEQVLSYLTGRVGGTIGRGIEKATGLSQVRIEPNLIANESDPSARLTIGQNLTRRLNLIYSMNLTDSSDQIYVGEYDITKRFRTRGLKQSDNSYRFDFSHLLQFGGTAPAPRSTAEREQRKVGTVQFTGSTIFPEKELSKKFKIKEGGTYDFFKVRKGLDRVEQLYADKGLLEAKIRLNRENQNSVVDLDLDVQSGPRVDFVYEGLNPPGGLKKQVRQIWQAGVFDTQRAEEAVTAITSQLVKDDYLRPKIDYSITTPEADHKRVLFDIQSGVKYHGVKIEYAGAHGVEPSELRAIVKEQKLETAIYTDPDKLIDLLSRYYRERGYLEVKIEKPKYALDAASQTGTVSLPIAEGPLFRVGEVAFIGNTAYDANQLRAAMALKSGETYTPETREGSLNSLRALYGAKGYNNTDIRYTLARNVERGLVDVNFSVTEGQQTVVKGINVTGTDATSEQLVRNQLEVKPGDVLDLNLLSKSRRNLYSTGAYSLVDIDRRGQDLGGNLELNQRPVMLNVKVQEVRPFQMNYGGYFDTDRGPGALVDFSNRNSLGAARVAGLRVRYDRDLQESRIYFSQPFLRVFPVRTIASSYVRREKRTDFTTDRLGASIEQQARFWTHYILNYGYRLEQTHTYENVPDPLFDQSLRVAPLTATLSRETRDDIFDATRGSFFSNAFEYAPSYIGSQLNYVKYFAQFSKYFAFDDPKPIPFQKGVRKSRLVYATAARVGLAKGLGGQDLIPGRSQSGSIGLGERFFAGGGTTIRGFEQDGVGPRGPLGGASGGDALLVLNNEMRFPLFSIVDGVGFIDIGNVYSKIGDFSFTDIRKAAGVGLRIRTPYFLIRFDYGVKLDRKPGEPRARPFFSIGQAF